MNDFFLSTIKLKTILFVFHLDSSPEPRSDDRSSKPASGCSWVAVGPVVGQPAAEPLLVDADESLMCSASQQCLTEFPHKTLQF